MDEFYLFWNAFNLIVIASLILTLGISLGGLLSSIIGVITQIDDTAIRFSIKFVCLVATCYFCSPFILGSVKDFTVSVWDNSPIKQ